MFLLHIAQLSHWRRGMLTLSNHFKWSFQEPLINNKHNFLGLCKLKVKWLLLRQLQRLLPYNCLRWVSWLKSQSGLSSNLSGPWFDPLLPLKCPWARRRTPARLWCHTIAVWMRRTWRSSPSGWQTTKALCTCSPFYHIITCGVNTWTLKESNTCDVTVKPCDVWWSWLPRNTLSDKWSSGEKNQEQHRV